MTDKEKVQDHKLLSPSEFATKMKEIDNSGDNESTTHWDMDCLMCSLLESLGYEDGIAVFRKADKWYS